MRFDSRFARHIATERGMSIVTILIAISLVSLVAMAILPSYEAQMKNAARINAGLSAMIVRNNLASILQNDVAWAKTVTDSCNSGGGNWNCLADTTGNCFALLHGGPQELKCLVDADGAVIWDRDADHGSQGFTESGELCKNGLGTGGFDSANGNSNCPFRPKITVELRSPATCVAGSCSRPPIKVKVLLDYKSATKFPFNAEKYAIKVDRN